MFNDNAEGMIALLTLTLGALTVFHSLLTAFIGRRADRRERTVELYDGFYSVENYHRVILPVYRLMLKWRGLPDDAREKYREAVRLGWVGADDPSRVIRAYIPDEHLHDDPQRAHFRDTVPGDHFTEHEALTIFLYFWTKVDQLISTGQVDPRLFKRLFAVPFGYYRDFLEQLRDDMRPHFTEEKAPAWIRATEKIDDLVK